MATSNTVVDFSEKKTFDNIKEFVISHTNVDKQTMVDMNVEDVAEKDKDEL